MSSMQFPQSNLSAVHVNPRFCMNEWGSRLEASSLKSTISPIKIKACEVHIMVGCSDSRDVTSAFNQAVKELRAEYARRGVYVEMVRENVAGNFINQDVFSALSVGLKDHLFQLGDLHEQKVPIAVFVHIVTHGSVKPRPGCAPGLKFTVHELEFDASSPYNCGMRNAEALAQELELELLTAQPTFELSRKGGNGGSRRAIKLEAPDDLRALMQQAYGHDHMLSASWVRSISRIPNHALEQKQTLRDLIDRSDLRQLGIQITAGVHNYQTHSYHRVDGNTHLNTFLDEVFQRKQAILEETHADHQLSIKPQAPRLGVFHHSFIEQPRATALALHNGEPYLAGSVFAIGSGVAGEFHRPQGPYRIVAFYYAVKHLEVRDWVVLGRNALETTNMVSRITGDPLMGWIVKNYDVRLHKYCSDQLNDRQKACLELSNQFLPDSIAI